MIAGPRRIPSPSRGQPGFTLIEILVVLVIIGVVLTFATLSVNPTGPGDRLDAAAHRLFGLSQAAADEAILSGRTIGLLLTDDGYRFMRLTDSGWQTITAPDNALRPRTLGPGLHLDTRTLDGAGDNDNRGRRQARKLLLPPSPVAPTPSQAKAQAERQQAARERDTPVMMPAALFLASGELLPFALVLSADEVDQAYVISGQENGDIALQQVAR